MTQPIHLPQRVRENAPGDFYVEADICLSCCLPHAEAPDLLNDPKQPFKECYFRRQPRTPEEVDRAVDAIAVSDICALRYAGADPSIIAKLRKRGCAAQCDQTPEGLEELRRIAERRERWKREEKSKRAREARPWWRRFIVRHQR